MTKIAAMSALGAVLLCSGCMWQQQKADSTTTAKEENVLPPLHLGAVHQVYPEQGFVLLRIIGPMPRAGTVLISHPADGSNTRIGNLVVTSDQPAKNRIIAAEVRSGTPMKGDRVFMYRSIAQPVEQPEPAEEPAEINVPAVAPADPIPVIPQNVKQDLEPQEPATPVEEEPKRPKKDKQQPAETPKHIWDIPDNIDDWD